MQSSTLTASNQARLKKSLTPEGRQVLQILQVEYQMAQSAALKLMRDGGQLLALAVLTRGRGMSRSIGAEASQLRTALAKAGRQNTALRSEIQRLREED